MSNSSSIFAAANSAPACNEANAAAPSTTPALAGRLGAPPPSTMKAPSFAVPKRRAESDGDQPTKSAKIDAFQPLDANEHCTVELEHGGAPLALAGGPARVGFSYRFFEDELLHGYAPSLRVRLRYDASLASGVVTIDGVRLNESLGAKIDNIPSALRRELAVPEVGPEQRVHIDSAAQPAVSATVPGVVVASADIAGVGSLQVRKASFVDEATRRYHAGPQSLVKWFIEGAEYIDTTDPSWLAYYLVLAGPGGVDVCTGFATVYQFYSHPDKTRLRIAQIMILPHFQRKGLGTLLYQSIMNDARASDAVRDVTVEDAGDDFSHTRLLADVSALLDAGLLERPSFEKEADLVTFVSTPASVDCRRRAQEQLRMFGPHVRRCSEAWSYCVLRSVFEASAVPAATLEAAKKALRLRVKGRYFRENCDSAKVRTVVYGDPDTSNAVQSALETAAAATSLTPDQVKAAQAAEELKQNKQIMQQFFEMEAAAFERLYGGLAKRGVL